MCVPNDRLFTFRINKNICFIFFTHFRYSASVRGRLLGGGDGGSCARVRYGPQTSPRSTSFHSCDLSIFPVSVSCTMYRPPFVLRCVTFWWPSAGLAMYSSSVVFASDSLLHACGKCHRDTISIGANFGHVVFVDDAECAVHIESDARAHSVYHV